MSHFHWERFVGQVRDAIASDASPVLLPRTHSSPPIPRNSAVTMGKFAARNVLYGLERRWPELGLDSPALKRMRNWMRR